MKKILLINDDPYEAGVIEEIIGSLDDNFELCIVENGRKALNALMGSSKYPNNVIRTTDKFRPDIILLDKDLPDMSALEFLSIMRKYYSLENIKIFILAEMSEVTDQSLPEKFSITGFLRRPFENNASVRENFRILETELNDNRSYLFFPFLTFAKLKNALSILKKNMVTEKLRAFQMGSSAGIKISACIAGMSIITASAIYSESEDSKPAVNKLLQHASVPSSVRTDDLGLYPEEINSNHAGLYILESGELDLKTDKTLTFFSASGSGKPCYKSAGSWKLENDSTITATFFRDSAIVRYKILSDNTIATREISDLHNSGNRKIVPITSPSLLIRIKGYYPDGNVEWAMVDKWIRDHVSQKLFGNCVYYFPTGEVSSRGRFKNGLREGRWKYFDKTGKKIKTEFYRKGLIVRTKNSGGN